MSVHQLVRETVALLGGSERESRDIYRLFVQAVKTAKFAPAVVIDAMANPDVRSSEIEYRLWMLAMLNRPYPDYRRAIVEMLANREPDWALEWAIDYVLEDPNEQYVEPLVSLVFLSAAWML